MASHVSSPVNNKFADWLNSMYGHYSEVKQTRGNFHHYLAMHFNFSHRGQVRIHMKDYIESMLNDFLVQFTSEDSAPTPAPVDLHSTGTSPKMPPKEAEIFHTFVAKALFLCKRACPDIQLAVATLCTRVKDPNQDDWCKLLRLMVFLSETRDDELILFVDHLDIIRWFVNTAFAVHPDFKSHTTGAMTLGRGCILNGSCKQKLNTRSSTEAELVGADDMSQLIFWTKLFVEAQGYEIKHNMLYQDNKSIVLLMENGKSRSTKRTRALHIRYFYLTNHIEKGNIEVHCCPTNKMVADYHSKPL